MADIDVLLEIRGLRQSTEGLDEFRASMLRLREQIAQAGTLVSGLDGALAQFNSTGTVSVSTIFSMASALPSLVNPATAVAAAVGVAVVAVKQMAEASKRAREEALKLKREAFDELTGEALRAQEATLQAAKDVAAGLMTTEEADALQEALKRRKEYLEIQKAGIQATKQEVGEANKYAEAMGFDGAAGSMMGLVDAGTEMLLQTDQEIQAILKKVEARRAEEKAEEDAGKAARDAALARVKARIDAQKAFEESQVQARDALALSQKIQMAIAQGLGGDELSMLQLQRSQMLATLQLEAMQQGEVNQAKLDEILILDQLIEKKKEEAATAAEVSRMVDSAVRGVAAGAYDSLVDSIDQTISVQNLFAEATGRAMRNAVANVLKALGREAAIKSVFNLAEALAAYAGGNVASGSGYLAASAKYAAVATAAGVAAAALSVAPAQAPSPGASETGSPGGPRTGVGPNATVNQTVVVIGTLDARGAEELSDQLARARESRDLSRG